LSIFLGTVATALKPSEFSMLKTHKQLPTKEFLETDYFT
jgi:hypothetical protein